MLKDESSPGLKYNLKILKQYANRPIRALKGEIKMAFDDVIASSSERNFRNIIKETFQDSELIPGTISMFFTKYIEKMRNDYDSIGTVIEYDIEDTKNKSRKMTTKKNYIESDVFEETEFKIDNKKKKSIIPIRNRHSEIENYKQNKNDDVKFEQMLISLCVIVIAVIIIYKFL